MKTDQDFVKCQFFSRFFVWQCSPSVCKSRSPRSLGSSSGDRAPFVFLPQEIRRTSCHLSNTRPYTPAFPLLPFFGAQKCQKWLRFKPATHPPNPQTSRVLPSPGTMPRFQLRCGRCPLHASETAVGFSPAHPKFQKSIFCRIDLQDSSMICSYFFNDIFVPFRPPGGLATRRQNVGFHLQHLIWHFLQLLRCCESWQSWHQKVRTTSASAPSEPVSCRSSGWRGHVPKLLRIQVRPEKISKQ